LVLFTTDWRPPRDVVKPSIYEVTELYA
jgi:hypothetical protein